MTSLCHRARDRHSRRPLRHRRPDFSARFPNSSYDFSRTPSRSDLDLDGVDAWVDLKYRFTRNVFARGAYRYFKYDDNSPYLYDLTGRNNLLYLSLGYIF